MRILKLLVWSYFFILSTIFLTIPFADIWFGTHTLGAKKVHVSPIVDLVSSVLGIIFLVASWLAWRDRASERAQGWKWMILASLLSMLMSIGSPLLYSYGRGVGAFWQAERIFGIPTAIGIVGLVVFSRERAARA
jgi:uncharacterized membrane protein